MVRHVQGTRQMSIEEVLGRECLEHDGTGLGRELCLQLLARHGLRHGLSPLIGSDMIADLMIVIAITYMR